MENKNYFTIGALVIAVLTLGIIGYSVREPVVNNNIQPVVELPSPPVGAISGPEITSPFVSFNGVEHWYYSSKFNTASTTLCSFKSPSATSTLVSALFSIKKATSSAIRVDIGKATGNPTATSTLLGTGSFAGNAQGTLQASTTPGSFVATSQIDMDTVFAPSLNPNATSTYLNFKYGGTAGDTTTMLGSCFAEFIVTGR